MFIITNAKLCYQLNFYGIRFYLRLSRYIKRVAVTQQLDLRMLIFPKKYPTNNAALQTHSDDVDKVKDERLLHAEVCVNVLDYLWCVDDDHQYRVPLNLGYLAYTAAFW